MRQRAVEGREIVEKGNPRCSDSVEGDSVWWCSSWKGVGFCLEGVVVGEEVIRRESRCCFHG